jgi:hypothetical protein
LTSLAFTGTKDGVEAGDKTGVREQGAEIRDQGSGVIDQGSEIRNQGYKRGF